MNRYKVWIIVPQDIEINANSEEEAKELVLRDLIRTKQIKPADLIELKAVKIS